MAWFFYALYQLISLSAYILKLIESLKIVFVSDGICQNVRRVLLRVPALRHSDPKLAVHNARNCIKFSI